MEKKDKYTSDNEIEILDWDSIVGDNSKSKKKAESDNRAQKIQRPNLTPANKETDLTEESEQKIG